MKDSPEWTSCFNLCVLVFGQESLCSWIHMCAITCFLQALNGMIKRLVWAVPFPPALLQADTNLQECPVWAAVPFHIVLKSGVAYVVTLRF